MKVYANSEFSNTAVEGQAIDNVLEIFSSDPVGCQVQCLKSGVCLKAAI